MGTSIKLHNKTIDKTSSILSPDNQTEDLEIKLPNKNGTLATTEDLGSAVNEEKVTEIINKVVMGEPATGEGGGTGGTTENKNYKVYYKGERLVRALREDKIITVGAKGDCKTLGEALEEASYWHSVYNPTLDWSIIPKTVTGIKNPQAYNRKDGKSPMLYIKILSGTKLNEQINIIGQNLGHVMVIAEDSKVLVTNDKFFYTAPASGKEAEHPDFPRYGLSNYQSRQGANSSVFIYIDSSISPFFNCVFENDKKYVMKPHPTVSGVKYSDFAGIGSGVYCYNSVLSMGNSGGLTNFAIGIYSEISRIAIGGSIIKDTGTGLWLDRGSHSTVELASFLNCNMGIENGAAISIFINNVTFKKGENVGGGGRCFAFRPPFGGAIYAYNLKVSGGYNGRDWNGQVPHAKNYPYIYINSGLLLGKGFVGGESFMQNLIYQ